MPFLASAWNTHTKKSTSVENRPPRAQVWNKLSIELYKKWNSFRHIFMNFSLQKPSNCLSSDSNICLPKLVLLEYLGTKGHINVNSGAMMISHAAIAIFPMCYHLTIRKSHGNGTNYVLTKYCLKLHCVDEGSSHLLQLGANCSL